MEALIPRTPTVSPTMPIQLSVDQSGILTTISGTDLFLSQTKLCKVRLIIPGGDTGPVQIRCGGVPAGVTPGRSQTPGCGVSAGLPGAAVRFVGSTVAFGCDNVAGCRSRGRRIPLCEGCCWGCRGGGRAGQGGSRAVKRVRPVRANPAQGAVFFRCKMRVRH